MGLGLGLLILLVFGITWFYVDARSLLISDVLVMQVDAMGSKNEVEAFQADIRNDKVCTICEQYTAQAIYYLGENKTQTEIIDTLHQECSRLHSMKQQCMTLVDYYAPLFFLEIATVEPGKFCSKMNLCDGMARDSCTLCHEAIDEVLTKLQDPDTQLEVIEVLLKLCDAANNYAKKCKRLVFEYGPLIMANAEQFLEKRDWCTTIHACKASPYGTDAVTSMSLVSES